MRSAVPREEDDDNNIVENPVFPHLSSLKDPVRYINSKLQEAAPLIEGMRTDSSSHGIRIGVSNYLAEVEGVELHHVIQRGGWDFKSVSKVFEYLLNCNKSLNVSGRAVSGWSHPRKRVYPPRVECFMNKNNTTEIQNFMKAICNGYPFQLVLLLLYYNTTNIIYFSTYV